MTTPLYHCGLPGCLVCNPRNRPRWGNVADIMRRTLESMDDWRRRERERLRRLYPQPGPMQRLVEEIGARRGGR